MDEDRIVSTGIKVERSMLDELQKAADERCLGRNLLIRMAIRKFLDELIPIEDLTRKRETNESNPEVDSGGHFHRYLRNVQSGVPAGPPSGAADPTGDGKAGLR